MTKCDSCEVYESQHAIAYGTDQVLYLCDDCACRVYAMLKDLVRELQRKAEERNRAKHAEKP